MSKMNKYNRTKRGKKSTAIKVNKTRPKILIVSLLVKFSKITNTDNSPMLGNITEEVIRSSTDIITIEGTKIIIEEVVEEARISTERSTMKHPRSSNDIKMNKKMKMNKRMRKNQKLLNMLTSKGTPFNKVELREKRSSKIRMSIDSIAVIVRMIVKTIENLKIIVNSNHTTKAKEVSEVVALTIIEEVEDMAVEDMDEEEEAENSHKSSSSTGIKVMMIGVEKVNGSQRSNRMLNISKSEFDRSRA